MITGLGPVLAVATGLQRAGVVVAVAAAAALFALPSGRYRVAAMAAALVLTPALLISTIYNSEQLASLRSHALLLVAVAVAGLICLALVAMLFRRWPELFALAAIAALPFRIPIAFGGTSANLLVPLYLVVAAGGIVYVVDRWRGAGAAAQLETNSWRRLELVLMAFVCLYAFQSLYSADFAKALDQIIFFLVPFALLAFLLLRVRWSARLTALCLGVLVLEATAFVGIGFWEYESHHLFWNSKVIDANQFASYFRVNSVFYDPNVYGRFLMVVMTAVMAVVLFQVRRGSRLLLAAALLAIFWGGLVVTFSQSSFGALLVGLGVLAALRWSLRWTLISAAMVAVAGVIFALAFANSIHLQTGRFTSLNNATSGRLKLIGGGLELFAERPIWGFGSGSFNTKYEQEQRSGFRTAVSASHTTPVTVAAEQGIVGLIAYGLLLYVAFAVLLQGIRGPPGRRGPGFAAGYLAARAAVAAAFCGIVFHTLIYSAFLEDPYVWAALAIGLALSRQGGFAAPTDVRIPKTPR